MYMQSRLRRRLKRSGEVFTVLLAAFVVLAPRLDQWGVLEQVLTRLV
ncbi:hypothetical protein [Devosia rhizoryzae]|nr:hypothetical protein [Devosia rhizoryzae]